MEDFSRDALFDKIPMGYKTVIICQKICFVSNGSIIKQWDFDKIVDSKSEINGRYYLYVNKKQKVFVPTWKKDYETYSIRRDTKDVSIYSHLWESYDEAEQFAKHLSEKENLTVMVSMVIDTYYWH